MKNDPGIAIWQAIRLLCKLVTEMGGIKMEKAFKTMTTAGASNIALGIIMVVTGIAAGVVTIVNGARLLKHRGEITF